jgi:putative membrane protein
MKTATRSIWIVIAVLIGLGLLVGGFLLSRSGWSMFGYGPGMMDGNFGFGMMNGFGFGGILPILFWIAIIGLAVWLIGSLVSRANHQPLNPPSAESPLDILKKRYARGEITKEQYQQMLLDLKN